MPRSRRFIAVPSDPPAPADPGAPPGPGAPPEEHSLSHFDVPAETTPTWELEMLVSGAVLFGLFQLPPVISDAFAAATPRLGEKTFLVAFEAYIFAKAMLYALIAGFVLHLAARAYWVALVGLDSVFPRGIRWEQATMGPLTRELLRKRMDSLPVRIERIDNFASVIFAAAFGIVFLLLAGLSIMGVLALATWLVTHDLLHGRGFMPFFFGLLAILLIGPLLAFALDRRFGERLAPDSAGARFIRAAALFNYRAQGLAIHGPITQTLLTNLRKGLAWPAMMLLIFGAVGAGTVDLMVTRGVWRLDGYSLLPSSGQGVLSHVYYADQRVGNERYSVSPFIQSDMVRDPYIRLFVPYFPFRDDAALTRGCRGSATPGRTSTPAAQPQPTVGVLACVSLMRAVSLDGRAVDPDYRVYADPQSGLRGLLGYVSVEGLARGRHMLVVQPTPLGPDATRSDTLRLHPDSIPFRL